MNKQEIIGQLAITYKGFADFIKAMDQQQFMSQKHLKWSPAQQLEHLSKSTHPLNIAMGLPKFFLRLTQGKAKRPSRSYEQIVAAYQELLKNGAKSTQKYLPAGYIEDPKDALCNYLEQQVMSICDSIEGFTEEQLDTLRLPHPLMGKLTIREMLYFTIYHGQHHWLQTKKNLI